MQSLCLDANILIQFLSPDEASPEIKSELNGLMNQFSQFWAPALLAFEIGHVLGRKEIGKQINKAESELSLSLLYQLPLILMWNRDILLATQGLQREGAMSFYDASYLAVAMSKEVPLLTNDQDFLKKSKKFYPAVFSWDEWKERNLV